MRMNVVFFTSHAPNCRKTLLICVVNERKDIPKNGMENGQRKNHNNNILKDEILSLSFFFIIIFIIFFSPFKHTSLQKSINTTQTGCELDERQDKTQYPSSSSPSHPSSPSYLASSSHNLHILTIKSPTNDKFNNEINEWK